ncbi:MAG: 30S ribosomal protein S13 [Bacillales bacterium]|jgi:small subunit ribosomal protein S13|nr:30S ribosomal protein S13 [Bacillales bacterium]
MARLYGTNVPDEKRIVISLTYIYGIGSSLASEVLKKLDISEDIRTKNLTDAQLTAIRNELANYKIEEDLRREVGMNKKRLMDIGSYRGRRLRAGLPSRGQKTKTNARTCKGPRKTIANKKQAVK